jgi:acyl carrier protein
MTEPEIYAGLTEIFHDLFADDSIVLRPAMTADEVDGWDSFNHLNIIVAVETRFGIKMQTSEIEKLTNIGDLIRAIEQKTAASTA